MKRKPSTKNNPKGSPSPTILRCIDPNIKWKRRIGLQKNKSRKVLPNKYQSLEGETAERRVRGVMSFQT